MLRLGSLFSGSGGFELAGSLCGIEPVFASEVEPYPIAVTRSRFPDMKHLGDISKVSGYEIEPVDIITFGSPCQDLSIAGKRAGLKHESNGDEETTRSGLFMEAVRIIKEMREATNGLYPRFALWENVPGAFSSNKGEDFRIVLEELIKIVEPEAVMPAVPAKGWPYADSYIGDGWSLAYRVFDAQYWGVPQRRRRIHLVLDLRGQRAREILFEREGLRGYFAEGGTPWQGAAGDAADRAGAYDCEGAIPINTMIATRHRQLGRGTGFGVGEAGDPQFTISAGHEHAVAYTLKIRNEKILDDQGGQQITVRTDWKAPTLRAETHGNLPCVLEAAGFKAGQSMAGGIGWQEECAATLAAQCSGTEPTVCITECLPFDTTQVTSPQNGCNPKWGDPCHPLAAHGHPPTVICKKQYLFENHSQDARYRPFGVCSTLQAKLGTGGNNTPLVVHGQENARYIVRRLTPTECARLQGFPDDWGHPDHKEDLTDEEYQFWLDVRNTNAAINGKAVKEYTKAQMLTWYNKLHTDSAEYKMWGNGIALPPALYCMQGMVEAMRNEIGG